MPLRLPSPNFLVVDTGPLGDFLLWRYCQTFGVKNHSIRFPCLGKPLRIEGFVALLERCQVISTTPGVFAEIHRIAREKVGARQIGRFWSFAKDELTRINLDEFTAKILDTPVSSLKAVGPVDSALVEIARKNVRNRSAVLGDDRGLRRLCVKMQVSYLWAGSLPHLLLP